MRGADAYGVVKTKTGACERRVIAPLTWAVEYGAASGDVRVGTATSNLAPPLRGAFFCALAHNANVAPLACLRNQPKLLHLLADLVLVPAREARCWRRTANRRADVTCLPVEEHASGVDFTFATHLAASPRSECQIQNSTSTLYLLVVL